MKSYSVKFTDSVEICDTLCIDTFSWMDNGYTPRTEARLAISDTQLLLQMTCHESAPTAKYHDIQDPVYLDSCMEFFFSVNNDERYCNLEMNSNGAYLCCIGAGRGERVQADILQAPLAITRTKELWRIDARISLEKVKSLFGVDSVKSMRGNFYKCGDETPHPHFGMWSAVDNPTPDFHRPEFFGALVIER